MSARVLVIEPDDAARALIRRALATDGLVVVGARSLGDLGAGEGTFDVAIVDELAGGGGILAEVRRVQRRLPVTPVIVSGALASPAVLLEVLRLGARDALPKPFTPVELRAAVARALERSAGGHAGAVAYAASIAEARDAIAHGDPGTAGIVLAGARAAAPFDAEAMSLAALIAEIEGRDADADHGYRAALALRHEEDLLPPDPADGLTRLTLYGDATPASSLPEVYANAPAWIAATPEEIRGPPPAAIARTAGCVVVLLLGINSDSIAGFVRASATRAFVLLAAVEEPEAIARALGRIRVGALAATAATEGRIDLARIERIRGGSAGSKRVST